MPEEDGQDRVEAKSRVPEGWEPLDPNICETLEEEDKVYNWTKKEFWDIKDWRDIGDDNIENMVYTSGMLAIRKIPIKDEQAMSPKPIIRMDKSSFLNTIKNIK